MEESYVIITLSKPEGHIIRHENDIVPVIQAAIKDGDIVLAVLERNIYDLTYRYIGKGEE